MVALTCEHKQYFYIFGPRVVLTERGGEYPRLDRINPFKRGESLSRPEVHALAAAQSARLVRRKLALRCGVYRENSARLGFRLDERIMRLLIRIYRRPPSGRFPARGESES